MQFDLTVTVERPIDEVFPYVSDPGRVPEWAGPAQVRDKLTEGPIGVGTRYRAVDKMPGRSIEFTEEITGYEPNERFSLHMSEPFNADLDATFRGADNSTRIDMAVNMNPTGFLGILAPILGRPIKSMLQSDLDNLKATLEARN